MIILMARPWCHPETGVWYLRSRLPADLAKPLGGQKATFEVGRCSDHRQARPALQGVAPHEGNAPLEAAQREKTRKSDLHLAADHDLIAALHSSLETLIA